MGAAAVAAEEPVAETAIVTQDQIALRAAPKESAPQQAVLWQGDTLEIRHARFGYLQVYDHRRERGGYVRASQVRRVSLQPERADELLAVVRFLRDTPGAEALGLAYVAAYLKAAPAQAIGSEAFAALGSMAERLARHASSRRAKVDDATIAAHLDVAASLGVTIRSYERDSRVVLCYDGEAFRRVLALPATDELRAEAALALTRPDCVPPDLSTTARYDYDAWRSDVLARAKPDALPEYLRNRLRLRSAGVQASFAFQRARRGEDARPAMAVALEALAGVNKLELAEEDNGAYTDAAVRVGASRWSAETAPAAAGKGLHVETRNGEPGQTCIALVDAQHDAAHALARRCTYGLVWTASASANAAGTALTLAVQPLDAWRELWVFQRGMDGWRIDVLPPSLDTPDVGYLEFAGWVPGKDQLLAAREAKVDGRFRRSFEVIDLATLSVSKQVDNPASLSVFYRSQDPAWKRGSVALR
ncbi:MAG: hypothetical protein J0H86_20060 [Xanthomonadaceae bacterium]|nr:hypothetical protein [Xanthomonadaceae bacterium]